MSKRYREYAIPSPREIGTDTPDYLFIYIFAHICKLYVARQLRTAAFECDTDM